MSRLVDDPTFQRNAARISAAFKQRQTRPWNRRERLMLWFYRHWMSEYDARRTVQIIVHRWHDLCLAAGGLLRALIGRIPYRAGR